MFNAKKAFIRLVACDSQIKMWAKIWDKKNVRKNAGSNIWQNGCLLTKVAFYWLYQEIVPDSVK